MDRARDNLIIGLDMDGVIIDNTWSKIRFAKKLGFDLKPEDTPADFIEKNLPSEVLRELRPMLYDQPSTALQAITLRGAKSGLERLKKSGYHYFLISRRKNPELAVHLLKKRGVWPRYFNHQNAFFVAEPEDKDRLAKKLGVRIYLDDQPSVLEKLTSVRHRFLMDRFRIFTKTPYVRVASWQEFIKKIYESFNF